jgi:acyl carrier protein
MRRGTACRLRGGDRRKETARKAANSPFARSSGMEQALEHRAAAEASGQFRVMGLTTAEQRLGGWVRAHLARLLGVAPESIALDRALSDYGLDSVDAVLMAGELELSFDIEVDPASFIQFSTFEEMISALAPSLEQLGERPEDL